MSMMTKAKIDITVLAPEKKDGWPDKRRWDKMDGKWLVMTTATPPHKPLNPSTSTHITPSDCTLTSPVSLRVAWWRHEYKPQRQ